MFIYKNWNYAPAGFEDLDAFLEHLAVRIHVLPSVGEGIRSPFGGNEHSVHGQLAGAKVNAASNARHDAKPVLSGVLLAEIVGRRQVAINRYQFSWDGRP